MSRSEHTPGKWIVVRHQRASLAEGSVEVHSESGRPICDMGDYPDSQDEANANLIIAVPDLLAVFEAAKRLLEAASVARGAPQAFIEGNFAHHADQIAAGWRDLKDTVTKVEADHAGL